MSRSQPPPSSPSACNVPAPDTGYRPGRRFALANVTRQHNALPCAKEPRHSLFRPCDQHGPRPTKTFAVANVRSSAHCPAMCERPSHREGVLPMSNTETTVRRPGHHKVRRHANSTSPSQGSCVVLSLRLRFRPARDRGRSRGRRRPSSTDPTGPAPAATSPTDNRSSRRLHSAGASPSRPVSRMHLPEAPQPNDGFSFPEPSPTEPTASTLGDLNPRHRPGSTAALNRIRSDLTPRAASQPLSLSPSHPLTLSPSHPLTLSPSHPLTLSPSHPLTLSPSPKNYVKR